MDLPAVAGGAGGGRPGGASAQVAARRPGDHRDRAGRAVHAAERVLLVLDPSGCGSARWVTRDVFTTLLLTRIGLFLVFAGLMAATVAISMAMA